MLSIKNVVLISVVSLVGACGSGGDKRSEIKRPTLSASVDVDKDAVVDKLDKCPGSQPDVTVDDDGCAVFSGAVDGLEFGPGNHRLDFAARERLNELVEQLQAHPDVVVTVNGHTDNRGSAADNLELSKQRVISVVKYLIANGVSPQRLRPYGYGESQPRSSNATPEGREHNRRIEINEYSASS
ncbi:MAG: OmpA family protein [Granulosicoccus sp.]